MFRSRLCSYNLEFIAYPYSLFFIHTFYIEYTSIIYFDLTFSCVENQLGLCDGHTIFYINLGLLPCWYASTLKIGKNNLFSNCNMDIIAKVL